MSADAVGLWGALRNRLVFDVELTWRVAQLRAPAADLGLVTSTAHTLPFFGALSFRVHDAKWMALDVRAGAGPALVVHHLSADFAPPVLRTGLGWGVFAGAAASIRMGTLEPFAEARGELGEAGLPYVLGRGATLQLRVGARWSL